MTESGKEVTVLSDPVLGKDARIYRHFGLGVLFAVAGVGVLAPVWRSAADENRSQAIAAVKAFEGAGNPDERTEAIRDLVRSDVIEAPIVIPPLIGSLADPAVEVRVEAARSLGPATSAAALDGDIDRVSSAVAGLKRQLSDQVPAVRIAAVFSLSSIAASNNPAGVIQPLELVRALTAMLDDPDATVRASTIAALGVAGPIASPEPSSALLEALNDESSFNRAAAARAIARFPQGLNDHSIPAILGLLQKEQADSPVREACIEVLNQVNSRQFTARELAGFRAALAVRDPQVNSWKTGRGED
jgi:HEAT repeat protein